MGKARIKYFRVKRNRWQEVSKTEWQKAKARKGARAEEFASSRKATAQEIAKYKLLSEWRETRNRAKYLWKGAAQDICNIISGHTPSRAKEMLQRRAKKHKGMAIQGYYNRAAKEVSKLIIKRRS